MTLSPCPLLTADNLPHRTSCLIDSFAPSDPVVDFSQLISRLRAVRTSLLALRDASALADPQHSFLG